MSAKLTVVVILQYVEIWNHFIVHLKRVTCYVSYISIKRGEKKGGQVRPLFHILTPHL